MKTPNYDELFINYDFFFEKRLSSNKKNVRIKFEISNERICHSIIKTSKSSFNILSA